MCFSSFCILLIVPPGFAFPFLFYILESFSFLNCSTHIMNGIYYCGNVVRIVKVFSNILFSLSIAAFSTPFFNFNSFAHAVKVDRISSNLHLIILMLYSSSSLLIFSMTSSSLLSFSSTLS